MDASVELWLTRHGMAWTDPSAITDIKAFEIEQFAATKLYPEVKENVMSTSFSHIFQGGYSAGYYSGLKFSMLTL
jgi:peptidyl-dipeptidase Dcp